MTFHVFCAKPFALKNSFYKLELAELFGNVKSRLNCSGRRPRQITARFARADTAVNISEPDITNLWSFAERLPFDLLSPL